MYCKDRQQLTEDYYEAVDAFTNSVIRLHDIPQEDFASAHALSERARRRCEEAREVLDRHLNQHQCAAQKAAS